MMDFIKKNMALTIVLVITLAAAGYLTYLFLGEIEAYDNAKKQLDAAVKTSEDLSRAKISPTDTNLNAVKDDEKRVQKLVNDVHVYFGHPYRKAGEKFKQVVEKELPTLDYNKYVEAVKTAWTSDNSKLSMGGKFLKINASFTKDNDGFDPIPKDVLEKAIKAFEVQFDRLSFGVKMKDYKKMVTKIPFYLDTIGIDRTMRQTASRRYMNDQREAVLDYLKSKDCYYVNTLGAFFSFGLTPEQVPPLKNIPIYIKQLDITYDLLKRLADSSVVRLTSYSNASLQPVIDENFAVYRFNLSFISSLDSLRKVLDSLNQAYKNNRVYSVKAIKIVRSGNNNEQRSTRQASSYLGLINSLKARAVARLQHDLGEDGYLAGGFYVYPNVSSSSYSGSSAEPGYDQYPNEMGQGGPSYESRSSFGPRTEIDEEKSAEEEQQKAELLEKKKSTPLDKFPGYGELVIGSNRDVNVQMIIDYTIYIGDKVSDDTDK